LGQPGIGGWGSELRGLGVIDRSDVVAILEIPQPVVDAIVVDRLRLVGVHCDSF